MTDSPTIVRPPRQVGRQRLLLPWLGGGLLLLLLGGGLGPEAAADEVALPPPVVRQRGQPVLPPRPPRLPQLPAPAPLRDLPRDPITLPPPRVRAPRGTIAPSSTGPHPSQTPLAEAAPPRAVREEPAPPAEGLFQVPDRPDRPSAPPQARPEDLVFEIERPGGVIKRYPEPDGTAAWVMVGNPRLLGQSHRRADGQLVEALAVKANTFVAWVDERLLPGLSHLGGTVQPAANPLSGRAPVALFEEAVLGLYAEGAVEITYGSVAFRSEALYLEPRTFRGLFLEPSFDGSVTGKGVGEQGVPVFTRARRGRLVAKGLLVFDDAEVSTNRSDDRIHLRVKRLTVEEQGEEERAALGPPVPTLLGFGNLSTQRYRATQTQLWAERLKLVTLPYASFGLKQREPFPMTLKRVDAGNRSSLGSYAFVGLGGDIGPEEDPLLTWIVDLGGYSKRGPGGGVELAWDRPQSRGEIQAWGVLFDQGVDRTGFVPEDDVVRGRLTAESRTRLGADLTLDAEWNTFTDRGFNQEFFERDALSHKERESYGRLLYRPGTWAATLTGLWHERDFVTETVLAPEAAVWVGSLPLLVPSQRGGLGIDLTSGTRTGLLSRHFDLALDLDAYEAWRSVTDTRVEAGVDVGDLRLSGWAGAAATSYQGRTDGGEDLTRTALLAGLRANLQLHRAFAARGGPFELDGLRHVVDLDTLASGRFADSHTPADVPFFDEWEREEQRSEVALRMRQRMQTRRPGASPRNVLDLETAFRYYVEDVAPYLQRTPWALTWSLRGEPRGSSPLLLSSEGEVDGERGLRAATAGIGFVPAEGWHVALAYRYLKDEAAAPLLQASWRWSEKYELRVTESYNFRDGSNLFRVLLRRFSKDHVWAFGVSVRDHEDLSLELDFRPAIGGLTGETPSAFDSQVDLDPTGAYR